MKPCTKCRELKPETTDYFNRLPSGNYRGSCKKCMAANTKKHYDANPQATMDRAAEYKEKRDSAPGYFTESELIELRRTQKDKCLYCQAELHGGGELDHKNPVSRGGDNWPRNMAWACRTCNRDKHSKTVEEFRAWRRDRGLPIY